MLVALVGCGGAAPVGVGSEPAAEVVVDPTTAATLTGTVLYDGPEVRPAEIDLGADPACSEATAGPVAAEDLVVNGNGTLRNAVVFVKEGLPAGRFRAPADTVTLDQRGCMYRPRVIALMVGQELEITNSDPTTHNIHPTPKENREWNRSQIPGGVPFRDSFAREEIAIPLRCNVHPWMKAWVAVLKHPYFAVTGETGAFQIKSLPPGEYTVEVWHEKLGTAVRKVALSPGGAGSVEFTLGRVGG